MFCRITSLKRICNSVDCYVSSCHTKHCWITSFTNDHSSLFMLWGLKSCIIVLAKLLHLQKHLWLIEGKLFLLLNSNLLHFTYKYVINKTKKSWYNNYCNFAITYEIAILSIKNLTFSGEEANVTNSWWRKHNHK